MGTGKAVELVRKEGKGKGQGLEEVSNQQDLSPRESWESGRGWALQSSASLDG